MGVEFQRLIEIWFDIHQFSYALSSNKNIESNGLFISIDSLAFFCHSPKIKSWDIYCPTSFNSWVKPLVNFSSPNSSSLASWSLFSIEKSFFSRLTS
jgi:hypothetical protein